MGIAANPSGMITPKIQIPKNLIAGIYFGFGVIFSQNQIDNGSFDEGMYVTKWNFVSAMPNETMVYALAIYSKLTDNDKPNWLEKIRVISLRKAS